MPVSITFCENRVCKDNGTHEFETSVLFKAVNDEKLGKRKPKGNRKNRENPKKDAQEAGNNLRKYHLYKTYINSCI